MIISLDYDETFTRDPAMWRQVIETAQIAGHMVVCVTARHEPPDPEREPEIPCNVFCTGGTPKRAFMQGKGIHVHVWIDDMPEFIGPPSWELAA